MVCRASLNADPDLRRFLEDLEVQRRSKYTVKHYGLTLNKFHEWLRQERGETGMLLRDATPAELKQYQIRMVSREQLAKNTLYIKVKSIQAFYKFLGTDQAAALKAPRRSQSLPKYLTEAEARRLLAEVDAQPLAHCVLALLLYSGLRVGELLALHTHDIDFHDRTIRVRSGKGDKDRLVVVAEKAILVIKNWLGHRQASSTHHLFPGKGGRGPLSSIWVQRRVAKAARQAGIAKKVTPHTLRHTLATTLLRKGGDIRFIQRILGHASIATTQVYTHLDDAELKRMYERAQPDF